MSTFTNKVVWITGASSGIGEALALAFAAEGAKLVISARRADELERVKRSLKLSEESARLPDGQVLVLPLDLEHTSNTNDLTKQVISKFGRIDILINNGGISQRAYAMDTPLEIDRKIMEINFFGTINLTKSVLPYMIKQKSGHIIAMSSISGKFGFYLRSTYSASKHALHGYFESLRQEIYNDNIGVLIVCPGKIKTDISINAVTGSGDKHNKMDTSTAEGTSAEECAMQILKAIANKKDEVFIGGKELRAVWIKKYFPKLFSKLIRKQKQE